MLLRLGVLAQARGIHGITWHWPLEGWSVDAPNADPRWKAMAIGEKSVLATGQGHTGQEALENLIARLESYGTDDR